MYELDWHGSTSGAVPPPSEKELKLLAAHFEEIAQELHVGTVPSLEVLVLDERYQIGKRAGHRANTSLSTVLAGIVHGLRRAAAQRERQSGCTQSGENHFPAIYPLESSALEGGDLQ